MSSKMSLVALRPLLSGTLLAPLLAAAACQAQTPATSTAMVQGLSPSLSAYNSQIAGTVAQWSMVSKTEGLPFPTYASFLLSNPGWPAEATVRKLAEKALVHDGETPASVVTFFKRYPPQSATAWLRFAEALRSTGDTVAARDAARSAWRAGTLLPVDESRLMAHFASALQAEDHDRRMDALLWDRSTTAAARQIGLVSPARRSVFEARLAMLTKAPDAGAKSSAVDALALRDAGYVFDKASWLRSSGQAWAVRSLLSRPMSFDSPPRNPHSWLKMLLSNAKDAANDGQWQTVVDIARQSDSSYAPGTVIRDRPIGERDVYTDLVWLGGNTALNRLRKAKDAFPLFERYGQGAKSPQVRAKGLYWAGRAAEVAGDRALSTTKFEQAAAFFDQFYGQLATERLGRPLAGQSVHRTLEISDAERSAFLNRSVVKAMVYLGKSGRWQDQSLFIRTIAATIESDADHVLATRLAEEISRPDLSVMVGRSARANGYTDYVWSSFPKVPVPADHQASWTMIHAIARQESQFDRQIVSHAGAKGLMQLMPGTARETAPRAGLDYSYASLSDPLYNIALGSTYFAQLMDSYGGNYVLSVAAYNAGPGNVNKWLRNNGDPRLTGDVLSWIEAIPLSETRNYVQRVLENAVVYDLLNPKRANITSATPLSTYLGKRVPG